MKISIEKEILEKTKKKQMLNLSRFVEECLKHYLGYADGIFPVGIVKEINNKIGKLQLELFLINQTIMLKKVEKKQNLKMIRYGDSVE